MNTAFDPESRGYSEDIDAEEEEHVFKSENLPLIVEIDERPQSTLFSTPILLSGLETESALANLSNKENNSPMFQTQVWGEKSTSQTFDLKK